MLDIRTSPQASTDRPTDAAGLHAPEETSDSGAHSIVSALKCDCGADADTMSGACWRCVRTRTGLPPVDTRHARELLDDDCRGEDDYDNALFWIIFYAVCAVLIAGGLVWAGWPKGT